MNPMQLFFLRRGTEEFAVLVMPLPPPLGRLTVTEREVVWAVLLGRSNAEIARDRGRSARTVANQLAAIYRKLGVRSRAELAARLAEWSGLE